MGMAIVMEEMTLFETTGAFTGCSRRKGEGKRREDIIILRVESLAGGLDAAPFEPAQEGTTSSEERRKKCVITLLRPGSLAGGPDVAIFEPAWEGTISLEE